MIGDLPIWAAPFTIIGVLSAAITVGIVLAALLSPGTTTIECTFGMRPGLRPWQGPACGHLIRPRWYAPWFTRRLRFWLHWQCHHARADQRARRGYRRPELT